jgi:ADP-ribose pyrophosphatase
MATVEVNLKEGEAPPEQHLEEGEHIERLVVPLSELYNKLQGAFGSFIYPSDFEARNDVCTIALSKEDGKIVDARQVLVLTSLHALLIS